MTDLVTDAAIDAAIEKVNRTPLNEDPLVPALNAAAKFIVAAALRRASNEPLRQTLNVVDAQESWRLMLRRLSDELEGK